MKYQVQMEPSEFEAMLRVVQHGIDAVMTMMLAQDDLNDASETISGSPLPPLDESGDAGDDRASAPPLTLVRPVPMVPPVQPATPPGPTAEQRVRLLHGRDVWLALIEMWRENFGVEGAPQPDRVAILARLLHMDGASIFAYLRSKQGLTDATRDVLCELLQRPLDSRIKREARLVAENIAQVCSFHAPNLAEMLEYSAEFHIIPE